MPGFVHTPYDDGGSMFRIGLQPLDMARWIEVDGNLPFHLREKERLDALHPDRVFMAEPGTEDSQSEVLSEIAGHLAARHGGTHRLEGNTMEVAGRRVRLDDPDVPPLMTAARVVQEDLVLMRRNTDGSGWRIAAASLHFPSSWSLAEKFGRALADVHQPVPGFARGTRNAALIDRIFDNLQTGQPVWRMNFSLYGDDALHHPAPKSGENTARYIRVEYQTLRKLPGSGDILFTIRIHLDPLEALARHPERMRLCTGLADALDGLDAAQMAYKGLDVARRDALTTQLRAMAQEREAS